MRYVRSPMVTDVQREWLTARMAELIERAGVEPYVAAPLVEASDRWFPDEWHPDDAGVARLAKRVFEYAQLADVEVETTLAENGMERGIVVTHTDDKVVRLDVDPRHLGDPLALIAHLTSLAAVVFRVRNELEDANHEEERRLVDLTTIYLGFGILTTNAAYRFRKTGELRGYTAITEWSHAVQGALPAEMMAYALATQQIARGASAAELRAIKNQLETTQADVFEKATKQLDEERVVATLQLPPRTRWPERRELPPAPKLKLPRLWASGPALPSATLKSTGFAGRNDGRVVLRETHDRKIEMWVVGIVISLVPTIALAVNGHGGLAVLALGATWAIAIAAGSRWIYFKCSDSKCGGPLKATDSTCGRCGGHIAGDVLKGENRLDAEERLGIEQGARVG